MTKVIELRPNRQLMNKNFEKYQFSADDVPIKREIPLSTEIYRKEPSANQDSYLEAQLFAFHNHLFLNPYDDSCWFVDKNGKVWRTDENDVTAIHQLRGSLSDCVFNPTISFTTNNVVAILNGNQTLDILTVDDKNNVECFALPEVNPGIILDVRYVEAKLSLLVAICGVVEVDRKKHLQVTLNTYACKPKEKSVEVLDKVRTQLLKVKGAIEYFYIEENGDYFHVASQDTITFSHDSSNPIKEKEKDSQLKIPKYSWSQDEDSLSVWVKIPEKYTNVKAKVEVAPTNISIVIGDSVLIQGDTSHRLQSELATWKQKDDTLEIVLPKQESGLMWNELIKGDTGGECLPNESLASEIHSRLAHLCTDQPENVVGDGQPALGFNAEQLEECDLQGKENLLQRANLDTHDCTHLKMLGNSNRVLFSCKLKGGQAVCLRHDHDGCVWLLGEGDAETWDLEHKYNFPGFGYIEASKANKKFCVSPSDGSYVAILEHTRHAFIYERPGSDSAVGKQRIVDSCWNSPIIGAAAVDKFLYVLTMNELYQLQVLQ